MTSRMIVASTIMQQIHETAISLAEEYRTAVQPLQEGCRENAKTAKGLKVRPKELLGNRNA
jgi:hypothetical protein